MKLNGGIQEKTADLKTAQSSLSAGSGASIHAIIPMTGSKPGDPHTLSKAWQGGSMFWWNWNDIRNMQQQCTRAEPPAKGNTGKFRVLNKWP